MPATDPYWKATRHLQTGGNMTAPIEAGTWPYYQFGTGNRDDQQMATVLRQITEAEDVFRQSLILCVEASRSTLPVVAIDAQAIPLTREQENPDAVDRMLGGMERVKLREVMQAVVDRAIPAELLAQARDAFGQVVALRLMATFFYGVLDNHRIPSAGLMAGGIEPGLPNGGRVDIRGDNDLRLGGTGSSPDPQTDADRGSKS